MATSSRTTAPTPQRTGAPRTVVALGLGVVVITALFLVDAFAPTFFTQPLHAVSFALVWLTALEHVRRTSSPETFGTAQGMFMAASAVGSVFGMLVWGPLYAARGGQSVFLWATALGAAAALLAFVGLHRARSAG